MRFWIRILVLPRKLILPSCGFFIIVHFKWQQEETVDNWKRLLTAGRDSWQLGRDKLCDGKDHWHTGKTATPLMNSNNQQENSSEWVGALVAPPLCERKKRGVKETVTPFDRVLRSCSWTELDEEQATDAKKTTESAIGSVTKSACNAWGKNNLNSKF